MELRKHCAELAVRFLLLAEAMEVSSISRVKKGLEEVTKHSP